MLFLLGFLAFQDVGLELVFSLLVKIGLFLRVILILICPRGVFLYQFCGKKVTRDTFCGCHGLLFYILARVTFDVTG